MNFELQDLKEKISLYSMGELSKNSLGEWCKCAYHDLLKGGYIEQKKIVIYPFLKTISTIHIHKDDLKDEYPCSEEEIKEIQNILDGKKDISFSIKVGIPFQVYSMFKGNPYFDNAKRTRYLEIKDIISNYKNSGICLKNDIMKCTEIIYEIKQQNVTLLDILEQQINKLFMSTFDLNNDVMKMRNELRLYAQNPNAKTNIENLLNYLECYTGRQDLNMYVSYTKGDPHILLIV